MAIPLTYSLSGALAEARRQTDKIKSNSIMIRDRSASQAIRSERIFGYTAGLATAITVFNELSLVGGIDQYAKDQYNDQALDIAAEFTAINAAIQGVIDWVGDNYPASNGFLLSGQYSNGVYSERTFSPASLAAFRVEVQTLIGVFG